MRTFYTSGTMGDAYVILCKLYSIAKREEILCRHYTRHKLCEPTIKEIYSLMSNIHVEFMNEWNSDIGICGDFEPSRIEKEQNRYNFKQIEYYPKFKLGDINHFNLPESYVTLQVKAGTHGKDRNLCMEAIEEILNDSKLPVVLIGEKSVNLPTGNFNILDLRDNTTIKEVINIIKNSQHFYGPIGLLGFIAVSQKVFSTVFVWTRNDKAGIQERIEAIEEWKKFLIKR